MSVEMMNIPFKEGRIPFNIPSVTKPCFTYYKLFGDLSAPDRRTPIVCLHGGPGGTHRSCLDFAELLPRYGFPVIVYDQIGCGESTNLDDEKDGDESFWTVSLFMDELDNLLDHFQLRNDGFYLLGVSWGASLGSEFATKQPKGLRKLVLGCPSASWDLILKGMSIRRGELPSDIQKALNDGVETQDFSTEAFKKADLAYFRHCLCRADPLPPMFAGPSSEKWAASTVLRTMVSGCRFGSKGGSLKGWDVTPRLHQINVPTLLWNGEFDQTHDICVQPLFDNIPQVRWYTFAGASHILTYEGHKLREGCLKLVGDFFAQPDTVDSERASGKVTNGI